MTATHDQIIEQNLTLGSPGSTYAGFGAVAVVLDTATDDLNGNRIAICDSADDVTALEEAGHLSANTAAALRTALAQDSASRLVLVGRDVAGVEALATALDDAKTQTDFWGMSTYNDRAAAGVESLSDYVEQAGFGFAFAQLSDADLLTAGLPAALSAAANRERTALLYHDDDAVAADVAWAANRLAFGADSTAPGFQGAIGGVDAASGVNATALAAIKETNKANVGLPLGGAANAVLPGQTTKGRSIGTILTLDVWKVRVQEAATAAVLDVWGNRKRLAVNIGSQMIIAGAARKVAQDMEAAGHFEAGEWEITIPDLTAQDKADRVIPVTADLIVAEDGRKVRYRVTMRTAA